jgi:hypothetical protein
MNRLILGALGLQMVVFGSSACQGDAASEPSSGGFRGGCLPSSGAGLVALSHTYIDGEPRIGGEYPTVFSNVTLGIAGTAEMSGDVVSGSSVTISDAPSIRGAIVEGAQRIAVAGPNELVFAARSDNDNGAIPCVVREDGCSPPVVDGVLTLNNRDRLVLAAGEYYLEGMSINGESSLTTEGDVTIYLDGPVTINNLARLEPGNGEVVLISASTELIKLGGLAEVKMHIFAPFAEVKFTGAQKFWGSAIADVVAISGFADLQLTRDLAAMWDVDCEDGPGLPELPPQPG